MNDSNYFKTLCAYETVEEIKAFTIENKYLIDDGLIHALINKNYKVVDFLLTLNPNLHNVWEYLIFNYYYEQAVFLSIKTNEFLHQAVIISIGECNYSFLTSIIELYEKSKYRYYLFELLSAHVTCLNETLPDIEKCLNYLCTKYPCLINIILHHYTYTLPINIDLCILYLKSTTTTLNPMTIDNLLNKGLPIKYLSNITTPYSIEIHTSILKKHTTIEEILSQFLIKPLISIITDYVT
jgi:hypothetical protein